MIVQKNFINKLKDFGLNSYESKLWTALLSRGISTAGELSDIANVPRSRSYDVLESLEKKGFIIMKVGKPIKYIAVHPDEVLKRVKKKIQEEADFKTTLMEQLEKSELLTELSSLHNKGLEIVEPGDMTGFFKGRSNVYEHMASTIRNSNKSVTILTTSSGLARKSDVLLTHLAKAKGRGVKIRIGVQNLTKAVKEVPKFSKLAELKNLEMQGRFVIVDNKDVTFMLLDDSKAQPAYDVAVWINSPYFAEMLQSNFDLQWNNSK